MLKSFVPVAATLAVVATTAAQARAHYIWATVEKGQVRFALLENVAEAPSAQFETYVAGLSPQSGGVSLTLGAAKDGARYAALALGQETVLAESIVGARNRGEVGNANYLLVYDAKGAASVAAAGTATHAPAELIARHVGSELVVSVLDGGKPVPQNTIWVQSPGNGDVNAPPTDANGETRLPWPTASTAAATASTGGFVGIRAMVTEAKTGESDGKAYASVHRWVTLTFPLVGNTTAAKNAPPAPAEKPFHQILRASFGDNHEVVSNSEFNKTVFADKLTKEQLIVHLQQRALIHNECHRILTSTTQPVPYSAAQRNVLVLLFTDLINLGAGWPTEAQARPLTQGFLQEIRDSEKQGPYFALGVQHVYYGGITNGGRTIGKEIGDTLKFTPTYYEKSDGYADYIVEVDKITDPQARAEMIRGGQAAYRYIIASSNEDVFKAK